MFFSPPMTQRHSCNSLWHNSSVSPSSLVHIRISPADTDRCQRPCGRWREQQRYWQREWIFLQEAGRYNRTVTCCGGGLSKQMTYFIRFSFSLNPPVFLSSWWTVMCSNWVECSGIINWGNGCKPPAIIYIARRCVVKIKGSLWRPATAWCHYFK